MVILMTETSARVFRIPSVVVFAILVLYTALGGVLMSRVSGRRAPHQPQCQTVITTTDRELGILSGFLL